MDTDKQDRIKERAYAIWEEEGRPMGRAEDNWQRAETEIKASDAAPALGSWDGVQEQSDAVPAAKASAAAKSGGKKAKGLTSA